MNLDPDYRGRGLGRSLLQAVTAELVAWGFNDLILWVLPENQRARTFYESEGWTADGTVKEGEILGVKVTDIRYGRTLAR